MGAFRPPEWPPPRFEAGLLSSSWVIPIVVIVVALPISASALALGVVLLVAGAVVAALGLVIGYLRLTSQITLRDNDLRVRFFSTRSESVSLARLVRVSTRNSKASLGLAPAMELTSADRRSVTVRLGWWQRESELLGILDDAARRSGATVDAQAEVLLRDRPTGESWSLERRRAKEVAARPPNRLQRALNRLPAPIRWIVTLALYGLLFVSIYVAFEGAVRLGENVIFPRQIDPDWATQIELPPERGDSWIGNVATDGDGVYLAARQTVQGFWGTLAVWSSGDGGSTWSEPSVVSQHAWPDAARHALAVGSDGTIFVAFAEQGPQPATQKLIVRTSSDGGSTWSDGIAVSPPRVGYIGLPVFLLTPDVHLIAYTDGQTGDVLAQRLAVDGTPQGEPAVLGHTERQLYSDADFHDAAIALASAQGRMVATWVSGTDDLRISVSDDGGASWAPGGEIDRRLYGAGRPRLASDGSTILLAVADPNFEARYLRNPFIRIWRSSDGGRSFVRGPDVTDVQDLGWLELIWAGGRWRLLYDACPGALSCATPPRIWYAESTDGESWSESEVVSDSGTVTTLGLVDGPQGIVAVWGEEHGAHDWTFHLARRER